MSNYHSITSVSLRELMRLHQALVAKGTELLIQNSTKEVKRILSIANLHFKIVKHHKVVGES